MSLVGPWDSGLGSPAHRSSSLSFPPPQALSGVERAHTQHQEQRRHSWDSNLRRCCLQEPVVTATRSAEQIPERRTRHADSLRGVLEPRGGTSCLGLRLCCAGASRSGRGGALASARGVSAGHGPDPSCSSQTIWALTIHLCFLTSLPHRA